LEVKQQQRSSAKKRNAAVCLVNLLDDNNGTPNENVKPEYDEVAKSNPNFTVKNSQQEQHE